MIKITALFSSPRDLSNSTALAESVCLGAEAADCKVHRFSLRELSVSPCNACDYCRSIKLPAAIKGEHHFCSIRDDMDAIYPAVITSSVIVLASPVYSFSLSAQIKMVIDRFYALWREGEDDGLAGRSIVPVLSFGDEDVFVSGGANALRSIQDLARFYRMADVHPLYCRADRQGETAKDAAQLRRAFALGEKLGSSR
jgi:multimeric flavodoxin WrbA